MTSLNIGSDAMTNSSGTGWGYNKGRLSIAAPNRTYSQKKKRDNARSVAVCANTPQLLVIPDQQ
ncbi:hypothetical protein P4V47_17320 [Brevibacillus laterosporus]|uniref:Uncharacterized protein n=1 Tax=Brevibacillus laterosporus TaxID=1465 RepID=A0AAP8QEG0_BRELA|nr:hypothetical protein [Brevibacillus laterosporus]MED1789222.1 hypothetical protein [Brevibacillus laterosporus]PPB02431.1 hypothetical protein C4A77_11940 [Brevibacillus laterosporus]